MTSIWRTCVAQSRPLVPRSTEAAMVRHTERALEITQEFEKAMDQLAHTCQSKLQFKTKALQVRTAYMERLQGAASELANNFEHLRRLAL